MAINQQQILGAGTFFIKKVSFTTTGETVEVNCNGHGKVVVLGMNHEGDYGDNDHLEVDEASDADGVYTVPAAGTITIRRQASGTSGLTFTIAMIGQ